MIVSGRGRVVVWNTKRQGDGDDWIPIIGIDQTSIDKLVDDCCVMRLLLCARLDEGVSSTLMIEETEESRRLERSFWTTTTSFLGITSIVQQFTKT